MAADAPAVNLKVLSPSSEFEGGVRLRELPAATTVRELRRRIQAAVPSQPAPERMRLIYRGKVVASDDATLEAVFGADNLRESSDQSLHLVLREPPPPPAGPALQTNPFRAVPQPRPSSQPPPHHHHHHHHHHQHAHPPQLHHHHVQQPLTPLGPTGAMPLPPPMQQQIAQALAQPGAPATAPAPDTAAQPADGAQPRPASAGGAPAPAPAPGVLPPGFGATPAGRTVRQEGVGPNGARWTVTYNDFTANMPLRPGQPTMPRPVPLPAAFAAAPRPLVAPAPAGVQVPLSWLLPRLRTTLQDAARQVDTARTWLAPTPIAQAALSSTNAPPTLPTTLPTTLPATLPSWRADQIREHLRSVTLSLNMVEAALSDPAMLLNVEVIALRQAAGEVRRQANELGRDLDSRHVRPATAPPAAATSDPLLAPAAPATRTRPLPPDAPQQLYLLSSPQGPVGILFDQQGTYTTAPLSSAMSSQTFIDQYNQNRQLIAALGQQIAQSSQHLHGQRGHLQPVPTQQPGQLDRLQPVPTQQPAQPQPVQPEAFDQAAAQRVIQNIVQNPDERQPANAPPANPPPDNDRVGNIAGHLWLMFKLACFVYIFAGGGGWYRPLMLGSIAIIVYIVQLGVFEAQLNVVRRHFEALLPNADRIAQARPQHANEPAPAGAEPRRNMTPEDAARRILQQQPNNQFGWLRDGLRTLERAVALFVASLWPGIGERMVHAQEERERLERVAASEARERIEEERRRAEAPEEKEADAREQAAGPEETTSGSSEKRESSDRSEKRENSDKSEKRESSDKSEKEESSDRSEKEESPHTSEQKESLHKKPLLERNATQTLSEDFMDAAPAASKTTDVRAAAEPANSAKGKERAVDGGRGVQGVGEGGGAASAEPSSGF
ncbi:ubiquitin family protein [Stagonosporopsis vannaccii]|nr:ubiquitin family protein [Stagonosporopsis vannaccii]